MSDFLANNWEILDALLVAIGLVIYVTASQTMHQRRHPSAAFAWVMGIMLFPYLVVPLYLIFGSRKIIAHRVVKSIRLTPEAAVAMNTTAARSLQLGKAMGLASPVPYEDLVIHEDGTHALAALKRIIDSATQTLEVSTFLIGRNTLGNQIIEWLADCANRGVKVRLLIDGIGIYLGHCPDLSPLVEAGGKVVRFVPPLHSAKRGRTNLRNHRKMVIVDACLLWCGGRNLSAEYFEGDSGRFFAGKAWIDLSFDLSGALALQARQQFEIDWAFATEQPMPIFPQPDVDESNPLPLAQLIDSGPDRPDDTLFTLLLSACFTAREHITAVTPYFVPDSSLVRALMLAARRGVQVDLIIPERSNHRLADFARHRLLRDLVHAGVYVWLHPEMLHAKAVLVDHELALAGSANLDNRSLFLNYEMMIAFYDEQAVTDFSQWVEKRRKECSPYVARSPGVVRDLLEGLVLWLGFQL